jgi:hypothetical protein
VYYLEDPMLSRLGRCFWAFFLGLLSPAVAVAVAGAAEFGPQGVVREFCRADGLGQRVNVSGWFSVAPLVEWNLEPAWDHVLLVSGYSVSSPRPSEKGALAVDVHYSIVGQLSSRGLQTDSRVETITYRVHAPDERGWRIIGPPPPPHLFADRVDVGKVRRSLHHGALNFLPNTTFVWHMFRGAGWDVSLERTQELLQGSSYREVEEPEAGDLVAYLRDQLPYHVGILEAEDLVVSSTLNLGIVRAPVDAFGGSVRYLRLLDPRTRESSGEEAAADQDAEPGLETDAGSAAGAAPERETNASRCRYVANSTPGARQERTRQGTNPRTGSAASDAERRSIDNFAQPAIGNGKPRGSLPDPQPA